MILIKRLLNILLNTTTIAKSTGSYLDNSALLYKAILILTTILSLILYILAEAHYYI